MESSNTNIVPPLGLYIKEEHWIITCLQTEMKNIIDQNCHPKPFCLIMPHCFGTPYTFNKMFFNCLEGFKMKIRRQVFPLIPYFYHLASDIDGAGAENGKNSENLEKALTKVDNNGYELV